MNFIKSSIGILTFGLSMNAQAIVNGGDPLQPSARPEVTLLILAKSKLTNEQMKNPPISDLGICSGAFISDRLVVTAGHCLKSENSNYFPYLARPTDQGFELIAPLQTATDYVYEEIASPDSDHVCSPGPKPLPRTQTSDVAFLLFPAHTSRHWFAVDAHFKPQTGEKLTYYGYGTSSSPFDSGAGFLIKDPKLRQGNSEIWRTNPQRVGFVGLVNKAFAADGDSGGPVLVNGKLVGVLNTASERCETQFGEDYAILNTASTFGSPDFMKFVTNAQRTLEIPFEGILGANAKNKFSL